MEGHSIDYTAIQVRYYQYCRRVDRGVLYFWNGTEKPPGCPLDHVDLPAYFRMKYVSYMEFPRNIDQHDRRILRVHMITGSRYVLHVTADPHDPMEYIVHRAMTNQELTRAEVDETACEHLFDGDAVTDYKILYETTNIILRKACVHTTTLIGHMTQEPHMWRKKITTDMGAAVGFVESVMIMTNRMD